MSAEDLELFKRKMYGTGKKIWVKITQTVTTTIKVVSGLGSGKIPGGTVIPDEGPSRAKYGYVSTS